MGTYLSLTQVAPGKTKKQTKEDLHTYLGGNTIYVPGAKCEVQWKYKVPIEDWVQSGLDEGTRALDSAHLTSTDIVQMGTAVLSAADGPPVPPHIARMPQSGEAYV